MNRHSSESPTINPLLAGGLMFALVSLLMDMRGMIPQAKTANHHEACQGTVNSGVLISREQLAQLLTVPERDSQTRVRDILKEPYCQLPSLQVRAGVAAEREVYPLAFDPQTRLVILYEGDEYAGYRFSFQ
jgi:hypothetical protein